MDLILSVISYGYAWSIVAVVRSKISTIALDR